MCIRSKRVHLLRSTPARVRVLMTMPSNNETFPNQQLTYFCTRLVA